MNNKDKIALVDRLLEELKDTEEKQVLTMVGTLNKIVGLKGFKKASIGTPVFRKQDRYVIFLESLDGKVSVEVPYYPETLQPAIGPVQVLTEVNEQI